MKVNPIFDGNPNSHDTENSIARSPAPHGVQGIAHSEKINPKSIAESSEPPLHIHPLK